MGTHTAATESTALTPTASHVAGALWLLLVSTAEVWELHLPSCELGGVLVQNSLGNFKIHLILCPNTCGCYVASFDQKPGAQISMPPNQDAFTDAQFAQGIQHEDGEKQFPSWLPVPHYHPFLLLALSGSCCPSRHCSPRGDAMYF